MYFLKSFFFWLVISSLSIQYGKAQEVAEPYTARAYWLEEKNATYLDILNKKENGLTLTESQAQWLDEYTLYLQNYYSKLPETEKSKYLQYKSQWNAEYYSEKESTESDILEESAKGVKPGKKYSLHNGLYGFIYGMSAAIIISEESEEAPPGIFALPFLTSGFSMLWPLMNKPRYANLPYSSVMLARHGKAVGLLHGASLGLAIFGDEPSSSAEILAPMVIASIGLGELGFQLGKKKNWSEGQIATYQYYGVLGPVVTSLGMISAGVERGRPFGIAIPVSGIAGYWIGGRIYKKYQFTRGDMLAASSFCGYAAAAGLGIVPMKEEIEMLAPLATLLAGTWINHSLLRDKKLSVNQGWKINYASGIGAMIGVGISLLAQSDSHNAYFLLSSAGGMIGWLAGLSAQTKNPDPNSGIMPDNWKSNLSLQLTPENYFLNTRGNFGTTRNPYTQLPVFRLSMSF
jgi:hypothetical protein